MKRIKKITALVTFVSLAVVISGCSVLDNVKQRLTDAFVAVQKKEDIQETSDTVGEITNSMTVGVTDFDTFNPLLTNSQTVKECLQLIYEPLFNVNNIMQPEPVLAEDYALSSDGSFMTVNLKQGIKWHDGSNFDAYDVEYTINQIKRTNGVYARAIQNIAGCVRISDTSVQIKLTRAVPSPAALLNFPIIKYQSSMNTSVPFNPIGTGPFKYAGQINTERYLLNKNESWHGGEVAMDMVFVDMLPDKSYLKTAFEANEIDTVTGDTVDLREYMPKSGATIYDFVTNKLTFMGFNLQNPIFNSENTRKAISEIIDKDEITTSVIYSRGVPSDIPVNPVSWAYYDAGQSFKQNLPTASFYLSADGWAPASDGTYVRDVNGSVQTMTFRILTNGESVEKIEVANNIAKKLKSVGINASVEEVSFREYTTRVAAKNFDAFIGEIDTGSNHDPAQLVSSAGNYFGYSNPAVDTVLGQIGMSSDENELRELYKQFGEYIRNDMPFIPLYYRKEGLIVSSKIKQGVEPVMGNYYRNAGLWSVK